jgi:hypothetical protein
VLVLLEVPPRSEYANDRYFDVSLSTIVVLWQRSRPRETLALIDHLRHAHFHNLKTLLLGGVKVLHYQVNVHSISESLVLSGSHLFWGVTLFSK